RLRSQFRSLVLFLYDRSHSAGTASLSLHDALPIFRFSFRTIISGAPSSSSRARRLFRLIIRRYRSFKSEVANRPPSSCTMGRRRSEEHTSELQSRFDLVCRRLPETQKV